MSRFHSRLRTISAFSPRNLVRLRKNSSTGDLKQLELIELLPVPIDDHKHCILIVDEFWKVKNFTLI